MTLRANRWVVARGIVYVARDGGETGAKGAARWAMIMLVERDHERTRARRIVYHRHPLIVPDP